MNRSKIIGYLLIFLGFYLLLSFFFPSNKTPPEQNSAPVETNMLSTTKGDYPIGDTVKVVINNTSTGAILFTPNPCPAQPMSVLKNGQPVSAQTSYSCNDAPITIEPNTAAHISFDKWNNQLFTSEGQYTVSFSTTVADQEKTYEAHFTIRNSTWFGFVWDTLFYRPIYNTLIFFTTILPAHDLGFSIIILTLIIRLILLIPNQRMMEQQKKMQKLQPKIAEIQKRFEGDQQKIGEETLKLWREHKVNPLGSCLPVLLQLPFLIALYYAIANGLDVGSTFFLYEPLKSINIETINANFLGVMDLSHPNIYVLPVIVGLLQFMQMKLSLSIAKKKKNQQQPKKDKPAYDASAMTGKTMTYIFPLLIAFMTASFPSGVGLYWGISTLFGIFQQLWVNREKSEG